MPITVSSTSAARQSVISTIASTIAPIRMPTGSTRTARSSLTNRAASTEPVAMPTATTAVNWVAFSTSNLIVLLWASAALGFDVEKATQLTAVVAVGIATGSVLAARFVKLERAVRVLPVGILMGAIVLTMVLITDWRAALVLLTVIGVAGGFFVVPMNALLQHRGHLIMGAGHSIAVQNFNENLSILALLGVYALMLRADVSLNTIIVSFGLLLMVTMTVLWRRHCHSQDDPGATG